MIHCRVSFVCASRRRHTRCALVTGVQTSALPISNCNYQPWTLHIASGESRDKLSAAFLEAASQQNFTWDFPFDFDSSYGIYTERRQKKGAAYYEAAGIPRDATEQRNFAVMKNHQFFGAPHVDRKSTRLNSGQ